MGAKTWMLVYAESDAREALKSHPQLDRDATLHLAHKLFPNEQIQPIEDGNLSYTSPPDDELYIGCFADVSVVAAREFGIDCPSELPQAFVKAGGRGKVYFHAMHSVSDWSAFAIWSNGELVRSLSLSPDTGILENIGQRLSFEEPFWSGQRPAVDEDDEEDPYPLPFHPLELGEAALSEMFGYVLEWYPDPTLIDPESIPLMHFKRECS